MTQEQTNILAYADYTANIKYVSDKLKLDNKTSIKYHLSLLLEKLEHELIRFKAITYMSDEEIDQAEKLHGSPSFDVIMKVKEILNSEEN